MPALTSIHFVRHGEVENPENVRYGRLPGFHISHVGRKQIEKTAAWLTRYPIRAVHTSPLDRTQQTATLIGQGHPYTPIYVDARLLENKTAAEFEGRSRDLVFRYPKAPTSDSETTEQVVMRMKSFCESMCVQHAGQHVVAVGHGDPIGLLYHSLFYQRHENPAEFMYPSYGCDWEFVFRGVVPVWAWCRAINEEGQIRK